MYLIVLGVTSCNSNINTSKVLDDSNSGKIVDTLQLSVGLDMNFEPWDVLFRPSNKLYNLNREKVELYVYDLENRKQSYKVKFEEFGPNGVGYMLNCYHYISHDSIYLIPNRENTLIRVNEDGEILSETPIKTSTDVGLLVAKGGFHMEILDGKAYIACLTNTTNPNIDKSDVTTSIEVVVDVNTGEILFTSSLPDQLYSEKNTYLLDYSRTIDSKGRSIYSFATSNDIYLANSFINNNEDDHKVLEIESPVTVDIERYSDMNEYYEYLLNNSYAFIAYDRYREIYYRGVRLKMSIEEIKKNEKLTGRMDDKRPLILAYNKNWELIGLRYLPKDTYLISQYFINENGLYISTDHPNSATLNENLMQFHCFQF
jgi:hypothetical protein